MFNFLKTILVVLFVFVSVGVLGASPKSKLLQEPDLNSAMAWEIMADGNVRGIVFVFKTGNTGIAFAHMENKPRDYNSKCETGLHVKQKTIVLCFGNVQYSAKRYPSYYRFPDGDWKKINRRGA